MSQTFYLRNLKKFFGHKIIYEYCSSLESLFVLMKYVHFTKFAKLRTIPGLPYCCSLFFQRKILSFLWISSTAVTGSNLESTHSESKCRFYRMHDRSLAFAQKSGPGFWVKIILPTLSTIKFTVENRRSFDNISVCIYLA